MALPPGGSDSSPPGGGRRSVLSQEQQDFVFKLLDKYGFPVVLVAYYVYKDWSFTGQMLLLMQDVRNTLQQVVAAGLHH